MTDIFFFKSGQEKAGIWLLTVTDVLWEVTEALLLLLPTTWCCRRGSSWLENPPTLQILFFNYIDYHGAFPAALRRNIKVATILIYKNIEYPKKSVFWYFQHYWDYVEWIFFKTQITNIMSLSKFWGHLDNVKIVTIRH